MAKKSLGPLPDIEIPDTYLTRICHGTTILFNGRIWKRETLIQKPQLILSMKALTGLVLLIWKPLQD